jgi:hypothetical protein
LISFYVAYKVVKAFGDRFVYHVNRQYLESLKIQLKENRLRYEREQISEEEYKKLEAELTARIRTLEAQLRPPPQVIDVGF